MDGAVTLLRRLLWLLFSLQTKTTYARWLLAAVKAGHCPTNQSELHAVVLLVGYFGAKLSCAKIDKPD